MSLVNLPLIECVKDRYGGEIFRRLDTEEIVFNDYIKILEKPFMLLLKKGQTIIQMNHTGKNLEASAVLVNTRYTPKLCKATYCRAE